MLTSSSPHLGSSRSNIASNFSPAEAPFIPTWKAEPKARSGKKKSTAVSIKNNAPTTGDKFNALDTYFEDNNLLIKTSDNRLLNYNQIQNYVQIEDPKTIPDSPIQNNKNDQEEIPAEVLAEIDNAENEILIPEDNIYGDVNRKSSPSMELGNLYSNPMEPSNQNIAIIKRALDGKGYPDVFGDISWDTFPKREIEMLIDVMQIPESEIIEYYINNISINYIKDAISCSIKNYIDTNLTPTEKEQETTEIINTFDNGVLKTKTVEKSQPITKKKKESTKK